MNMKKEILVLVTIMLATLLAYSVRATVSMTWNNPTTNGTYKWQDFTLNISTDINANCSYTVTYQNGTEAISETIFTNGENTTTHTTTLAVSSLNPGYNYSINVHCYNSSNSSDYTDESKWFLRDYNCGDTVISSWTLGHNLSCSGNGLKIEKDNVDFSCLPNIHISSSSSSIYLMDVENSMNVTVHDCNFILAHNHVIGIYVDGLTTDKLNITNNVFNPTVQDYAIEDLHLSCHTNISITNNILNATGGLTDFSPIGVKFDGSLSCVDTNDNITIKDNTIINHEVGISTSLHLNLSNSEVYINNNNITNNNLAFYLVPDSLGSIHIFHNWIYANNYGVNITSQPSSNFFLDYNGMGNYWGYNGNVCPGFIPGKDSNFAEVIDRYPYNDFAFTDYACDCGDSITQSTTLYKDLNCTTGPYALRIYNDNITLSCGRHKIESNGSVIGVYIGSGGSYTNTTLTNCIFNNTKDLAIYNSNTINLINITSYNASYAGIYASNSTGITITNPKLYWNDNGIILKSSPAQITNLTLMAARDTSEDKSGILVYNTTSFTLTNASIKTNTLTKSTASTGKIALYFENVSLINIRNVVISGSDPNNVTLGFGSGITIYGPSNSIYLNNITDINSGNALYLQNQFGYLTAMNSKFFDKSKSQGLTAENGASISLQNVELGGYYSSNVGILSLNNVTMNLSSVNTNSSVIINASNHITISNSKIHHLRLFGNINKFTCNNNTVNFADSAVVGDPKAVIIVNATLNTVSFQNNNISYNSSAGELGMYFYTENISNPNIANNYWSHDTCPLFLYGRDTNSLTYYDRAPINSTEQQVNCTPSANLIGIYKDNSFTSLIDNNSSNDWYYYYNNSNVSLAFEIIPSLFRTYEAVLVAPNDSMRLVCNLSASPTDSSNLTIWKTKNCTLQISNYSRYRNNSEEGWILEVNASPHSTNLTPVMKNATDYVSFGGAININPLNNESYAYYPELGGNTTDWSTITDFSNVTNLTFEEPGEAKIRFLEPVNLLDEAFLHALMNLSNYLKFEHAEVDMNSQVLKDLNKSAEITMYNVPSSYTISGIKHKLLMNGKPCNDSVCNVTYYNGTTGVLVFRVPHWTSYSVDVTPSIVGHSPSSDLIGSSITSADLKVVTDESTTCKYDTQDASYDSMRYDFTGNKTEHKATVSVKVGNRYTFYVRCRDKENNTMNSSFKLEFAVVAPASSGGGFSASYLPKAPKKLWLGTNGVFYFYLNNVQHKLLVSDATNDTAVFEIHSSPVIVSLKAGQEKNVDVDGDGTPDLYLKVNSVNNGVVEFEVAQPQELTHETTNTSENNQPSNNNSENSTTTNTTTNGQETSNQGSSSNTNENEQQTTPVSNETQEPQNNNVKRSVCSRTCWVGILIVITVVVVVFAGYLVWKKKKYY